MKMSSATVAAGSIDKRKEPIPVTVSVCLYGQINQKAYIIYILMSCPETQDFYYLLYIYINKISTSPPQGIQKDVSSTMLEIEALYILSIKI